MTKPLKFYQTLNQAPRSAKYGQHRRADPSAHCRPAERTDHRTGGADASLSQWVPWTPAAGGITWFGADFANDNPRTIEDAGIRAGEIIAPRGWRVERGKLRSIYKREHVWLPGITMTGDVRGEYGVHAFKDPIQIAEYVDLAAMWSPAYKLVVDEAGMISVEPEDEVFFAFGTVAMWGEVIEHQGGWRAEFAKVNSIDSVTGDNTNLLAELRERYGV